MSDDNDDEIRLRDQFAMSAMQALVEKEFPGEWFINDCVESKCLAENSTPESYFARLEFRIEKLSIMAYKIADAMRKARLKSFD